MRVIYSRRSLKDIDHLLAYVSAQAPAVADTMATTIEAKIAICRDQPLMGVATNRRGVYRYAIKKYRLTIFYRVRSKKREMEILRVVRGKRVKKLGAVP
jgi:addiction module RelE/StbE family toxin